MNRRNFLRSLLVLGAYLGLNLFGCRAKPKVKRKLPLKKKEAKKVLPRPKPPPEVPKEPAKIPVGISQGPDAALNVATAVSLVGGLSSFVKPGQTVLIKPNLTAPARSGSGIVTHVEVVKALIQILKKMGVGKIVIAEGPGGRGDIAFRAFKKAGYENLKQLQVELVDLNAASVEIKELPQGLAFKRYSLPSVVLQADAFINVAVLKTHNLTKVTLCLKNLLGVPPTRIYGAPRKIFHPQVGEVITDLNSLIKSHFAVIDGTVGMEGYGPIQGKPVPMNLVIASPDLVAADTVATQVMGFNPQSITHLTLAQEKGLGTSDMERIEVKGKQIAEVMRKFQPP